MQSYNPTHIHEGFRQCVLAVRHARAAVPPTRWAEDYNREARIFRSVLLAPAPEGAFDPWSCAFKLEALPGVAYLVT